MQLQQSFSEKNVSMIKVLKKKVTNTRHIQIDIFSFHCILHQESLCKAALVKAYDRS